NARRNVQVDLNNIHRAENTLRAWTIPEEDLEKVHQQARDWAKRHAAAAETPETKEEIEQRLRAWARVELKAPNDGVVIEQNVAVGELVVDNTINLFQIARVDRILIIVNAPEDDLNTLQNLPTEQRKWKVRTVGAPEKGIDGVFPVIGQLIDPNTHTAIVKGYIDNPDGRILSGQFASATVEIPPPDGVAEWP